MGNLCSKYGVFRILPCGCLKGSSVYNKTPSLRNLLADNAGALKAATNALVYPARSRLELCDTFVRIATTRLRSLSHDNTLPVNAVPCLQYYADQLIQL